PEVEGLMPVGISKGSEEAPALLVVVNPSGNRSRVPLEPLPFFIGRSAENHLVLRDNRISPSHARILKEDGEFIVENLKSRHGVWVNGERVDRKALRNTDRIEFGFPDSYKLTFSVEEHELNKILDQIAPPPVTGGPATSNLGKLRALV